MFDAVLSAIRKYWGYDSLRPLQRQAIECVLDGRDSVVVLPTGGGKSLCFQAPALVLPGLAVVVSPLISLMKDQVDALLECGVPAARLDSSQTSSQQSETMYRLQSNSLRLLYLSPERLITDHFIDVLKNTEVAMIAIDEAHCVSMWGHDFRPEYRQLGVLKEILPRVPIHAYTATATERVRDDIAEQLRLDQPVTLVGSFDRPNLVYRVERRIHLMSQLRPILDRHKDESGIIYCIRRADVDDLCKQLTGLGYRAAPYHAGMNSLDRKRNQDAFTQDQVDMIVATVAFGMGIDKSNVRYVIHTGMPKSLECYQQETGRAGRDSLEAECCLLYSGADYGVWKRIQDDLEGDQKRAALRTLSEIYAYCNGVVCRHKSILDYFGQALEKENCGACDVCLAELECYGDSLIAAQKILSCVKRLGERFGADYTASVLTGSREQRIVENAHDQLSTYGLLKEFSKRIVRDWIEQLTAQGHLAKVGEYDIVQVTQRGWRILRGEETPRLLKPIEKKKEKRPSKASIKSTAGVDATLFERLRQLRRRVADEKHLSAYMIFSDVALRDMARRRPTSLEAFLEVNGVGETKARHYGDLFVAEIKTHYANDATATA